jgi:V8-like Glu-specific endopeptidase
LSRQEPGEEEEMRFHATSLSVVALLSLFACDPTDAPAPLAAATLDDAGRICGANDLTDVEDGTATQQELATSVGMLTWDGTTGEDFANEPICSGALIAPNLYLTAGHCLDSGTLGTLPDGVLTDPDSMCDAMEVVFNHQYEGGVPAPEAAFHCAEVLEQEFTFAGDPDWAILRLEGDPGQEWGWLEIDNRAPVTNEDITLISHPSGDYKKISEGEVNTVFTDVLFTQTDSEGGSSGGPVMDDDGQIVATVSYHTLYQNSCDLVDDGNYEARIDKAWLDSAWLDAYDFLDQDEDGAVETGDWYGFSVAVGDFDCDGNDDIAAGAPYENVTTGGVAYTDAGAVTVRFGSDAGLDPDSEETFTQADLPGSSVEANDRFGYTLAVGDVDDDGCDDLIIGTPYEDLGGYAGSDHGIVQVVHGSNVGLDLAGVELLTAADLGGTPESGALFGWALATGNFYGIGLDDLAIGAPKDDGAATDEGRVYFAYGHVSGIGTLHATYNQAATGTGSTAGSDEFGTALAAGDFDDDGYDDLAIGVPGESTVALNDAGYVTVIRGGVFGATLTGVHGFNQGSAGETVEANDRFGSVLTSADFNGDGYFDLAVGVPDEDYTTTSNSGIVNVKNGTSSGLTGTSQVIKQNSGSPDTASIDANDRFGSALAAGPVVSWWHSDLVIGMTGHDGATTNTGLLTVWEMQLGSTLFSPGHVDAWPQLELGAYDELGSALAIGNFDDVGDGEIVAGLPKFDRELAYDSGAVMITQPD